MSAESTVSATIEGLLPSWKISLTAEDKSPRTITFYFLAVDQLVDWLHENDKSTEVDEVTHREIQGFIAYVLETRASATAKQRYASLQQLFAWLALEDEIDHSPFNKIKPPKVREEPIPVLTEPQLRAIIATTDGKDFDSIRDNAILRLFIDTGMRLGEMAGLTVGAVDLTLGQATILGKGDLYRVVPIGKRTTKALDRYMRRRRSHKDADLDALWLGLRGALSNSGISQIVLRHGREAGLGRVHPHQFRHTFAHRWLSDGGTEGDLRRIAGWKSPPMLQRYGASAADERARTAHKTLKPRRPVMRLPVAYCSKSCHQKVVWLRIRLDDDPPPIDDYRPPEWWPDLPEPSTPSYRYRHLIPRARLNTEEGVKKFAPFFADGWLVGWCKKAHGPRWVLLETLYSALVEGRFVVFVGADQAEARDYCEFEEIRAGLNGEPFDFDT